MNIRKLTRALLIAVPLIVGFGSAKATPVGLALAIDGSGSISAAEFTLQKNGYVNALNALIPLDGSIALGVWQFSTGVQQEIGMTLIDSAAALASVVGAISGMVQLDANTAIGDAINAAAAGLNGFAGGFDKAVIDVSTDGMSNTGVDPNIAAAGVAPIVVNCLGVGAGANCGFATGFAMNVANFADFETAISQKIAREIGVPEPGTLALLGLSLLMVGFARKASRQA